MSDIHWEKIQALVKTLYAASDELGAIFPGRKFTLDGHLVGSIGEVVAAYMFDLQLNPASTKGHDARTADGKNIEIKFTHGTSTALRHEPEHLIVLYKHRDKTIEVIYNGPGNLAWQAAGPMASNGQRQLRLSRLKTINQTIQAQDRIPLVREAPI